MKPRGRTGAVVAAILLAAVVLRVAWRVHMGSDDFFVNGYTFYYSGAVRAELEALGTPIGAEQMTTSSPSINQDLS
ncbi:MAG: hypothetical protein ABMA15_28420 [Vicinamibacterales bacterium]